MEKDFKEIITWEQVCEANNQRPDQVPGVENLPEEDKEWLLELYKIVKHFKAVKGGKKIDFTDGKPKYFNFPDVEADPSKPSGFGLSFDDNDLSSSDTVAGARLSAFSREQVKHVWDCNKKGFEAFLLE